MLEELAAEWKTLKRGEVLELTGRRFGAGGEGLAGRRVRCTSTQIHNANERDSSSKERARKEAKSTQISARFDLICVGSLAFLARVGAVHPHGPSWAALHILQALWRYTTHP